MDATKQNLRKKAHDKLMRLIEGASARDATPGVVKEASAAELEAFSSQPAGSAGSSETVQRVNTPSTGSGASAQQKGKSKASLHLTSPAIIGSASQNPQGSSPLSSQVSIQTSVISSIIIDADAHIPFQAPSTPSSTTDLVMESFNLSSLEKILPSADASPSFMQELDATSADLLESS